VPFADLPRRVNPPDGRFVSANNKIVGEDYPYFLGRDWDPGYRATRINQLLDATPHQTPDASAAIQADTLSLSSRSLLPLMQAMKPFDERSAAALERLRQWDGRMDRDKVEPLIFTAWLRELNRGLFEDRLGSVFFDYWGLRPRVVEGVLKDHPEWCSAPSIASTDNCGTRLAEALGRALDGLAAAYGEDMARWRWGDAHVATFAHPLFAHVPVLAKLTANKISAGGGEDTVNRGGMPIRTREQPFRDVHGAGYRMILDFADLDASRFMVAPGQSGNPLSPHYDDLFELWKRGEGVPMAWTQDEVRQAARRTLTLHATED